MKLNISNLDQLKTLLDEIHDRYFMFDQIEYDSSQREWNLFFGEKKKGPFNKTLRITGVTKYIGDDTEGTVLNSLNKLIVNLDEWLITLDCNVPIDIRLNVDPCFEICTESRSGE